MPEESLIIKSILGSAAIIALVLFFLTGGLKGIADAFSLLSIAIGLLIIVALYLAESGSEHAMIGTTLASVLIIGGLLVLLNSGLLSLGVIFLVLLAVLFVAPGVKNEGGKEWAILIATFVVLLFLSSAQGLLPSILRAFSLVILAAGILTIIFFMRVREKEIQGITSAGLMIGTVLVLLGLYLVLF
ncbi:MAG: hypothetical protein V1836_03415 [Candidatus Aenigmatarchaeota archaeon]